MALVFLLQGRRNDSFEVYARSIAAICAENIRLITYNYTHHSTRKRILVATTIEGIYDSIKSTLESKTDRFEIANVDVNDVSALTIAAESAQILVTDPAVLAQIETSCKSLQWAQVMDVYYLIDIPILNAF